MRLVAQFLAVPLLARLISPHDYGVIGIAMPFVLFALLIADSGVGSSLVRSGHRDNEEWSSCFWLTVVLGAVLSGLMMLVAPLVAHFYGEAELLPVIAVLALIILGQSLSLVPGAALQQAGRFTTIALVDLASIFLSIGAAMLLAFQGAGVWALVGQQLVLYMVRLTGYLFYSPFRPAMVFMRSKIGAHVVFGRDVLGVNLINFLVRAADNLVIGRVLGPVFVGFYSMAFQFLRLPSMIIAGPINWVLFSQLAPYKEDADVIRLAYSFFTRLVALCVFPAMGLIAAAHVPVFEVLLSSKWLASGHVFSIAAPAAALQACLAIGGTIMLVYGRTDIQLRTACEFGVVAMAGLLFSVPFGIEWVAYAYFCTVVLYLPRQLFLILPVLKYEPSHFLQIIGAPVAATFLMALFYQALTSYFVLGSWHLTFVAALLSLAAILIAGFWQRNSILRELGELRVLKK